MSCKELLDRDTYVQVVVLILLVVNSMHVPKSSLGFLSSFSFLGDTAVLVGRENVKKHTSLTTSRQAIKTKIEMGRTISNDFYWISLK